jgi:hypothetical protein
MKALEDVTLGEFILAEENAVRKKGGPWGPPSSGVHQ